MTELFIVCNKNYARTAVAQTEVQKALDNIDKDMLIKYCKNVELCYLNALSRIKNANFEVKVKFIGVSENFDIKVEVEFCMYSSTMYFVKTTINTGAWVQMLQECNISLGR